MDTVRGTGVPGDSPGGVLLAQVEEWDPPVPMSTVLSQIDPAEGARADFEAGVVRITANEYETAVAVAAERATFACLTGGDPSLQTDLEVSPGASPRLPSTRPWVLASRT